MSQLGHPARCPMSLEFYKIFHLIGIFMLLFAFGGVLVHAMNGGTKQTNKFRKGVALTHGVGLLLIAVSGFGMLARLGIMTEFPLWVILKIIIWLAFGGLFTVALKKPQHARSLWVLLIVLATCAAYLGIFKTI
jgi:hypothetical protein